MVCKDIFHHVNSFLVFVITDWKIFSGSNVIQQIKKVSRNEEIKGSFMASSIRYALHVLRSNGTMSGGYSAFISQEL